MTIRLKICGLRDAASLAAAAEAGADWAGFVFFPPSPRAILPDAAAAVSASLQGGPKRVGLFVQPTDAEIEAVLAHIPLDVLQVYAPAARAAELRGTYGVPVWRAIGVADAADLPREAGGADGFVIESKPPPGAARPGGNALAIDWTLTRAWRSPLPWLLAGGLNAGNVAEAIRVSGAEAVDVSSGVERAPGIKDASLIRSFAEAARGASISRESSSLT